MALNVCKLFISDWGIAITGYATPVPESDNKLFAYYSISLNGQVIHSQKLEAALDDPYTVKMFYIEKIMEELLSLFNQTGKTDNTPSANNNKINQSFLI